MAFWGLASATILIWTIYLFIGLRRVYSLPPALLMLDTILLSCGYYGISVLFMAGTMLPAIIMS
jgi:hypothetical protein